MNIAINIDDNGNPIFSQEGVIDIDSVIRDVLVDQQELKSVFSDKIKKLFDQIKIDSNKISKDVEKNITEAFELSSSFKKDIEKTFSKKIDKAFDDIKIDSDSINKSLKNLFSFTGKNKKMESIFNKIENAIPNEIKGGDSLKGNFGMMPVEIQNIAGGVFNPFILDMRLVDVDSSAAEYLGRFIGGGSGEGAVNGEDTVFGGGATPVMLEAINPSIIEDLASSLNMDGDSGSEGKGSEVKKGGGILGMLSRILGLGGGGLSFTALKTGFMSRLGSIFKLPSSALKFATNPVTLIAAGVIWGVLDGVKASLKADEWNVSKASAGIGGFFAGGEGIKGMFGNAGKWALIGAGVGSIVPVLGTIAGGLVGGALGIVFNLIGAEKIAKAFDPIVKWFDKHFGGVIDKVKEDFDALVFELQYTFSQVTDWYDEKLKPALDTFKERMEPVMERIAGIFNRIKDSIVTAFEEKIQPIVDNWIIPTMDAVTEFISEKFWPFMKNIGSFFGDALVNTIEFIPLFIDETITMIGVRVDQFKSAFTSIKDGISKGFEKIKSAFDFIGDKISGIMDTLGKLKFWSKDEEEQREDELKKLQKERKDIEERKTDAIERIEKENERIEDLEEKLAYAKEKGRENAIKRIEKEIKEAEVEIKQQSIISSAQSKSLESNMAKQEELKSQMKAQDVSIAPNSLQIQLDKKDTLETYGNQQTFSKEGGTLDKAINAVAEKLDNQLKEMNNFKQMFNSYIKYVSTYNDKMLETLPSLASSGGQSAPIPAEQSVPNGYIRDPNYEFRMRMREVLS